MSEQLMRVWVDTYEDWFGAAGVSQVVRSVQGDFALPVSSKFAHVVYCQYEQGSDWDSKVEQRIQVLEVFHDAEEAESMIEALYESMYAGGLDSFRFKGKQYYILGHNYYASIDSFSCEACEIR